MPRNSSDPLRDVLNRAYPPADRAHPSAAFGAKIEAGLRIAACEQRQSRIVRRAALCALASVALVASVAGLFWYAVDVPGLMYAHAPGLLGRLDAARLAAEHHAWAIGLAGAAAALGLPALAVVAFRRGSRRRATG